MYKPKQQMVVVGMDRAFTIGDHVKIKGEEFMLQGTITDITLDEIILEVKWFDDNVYISYGIITDISLI